MWGGISIQREKKFAEVTCEVTIYDSTRDDEVKRLAKVAADGLFRDDT